jgi:uncharacterized protein YndB with AHSA1/START domain
MGAYDTEPGLSARGVTFAAHTFAAWTRADPEVVWTALTDPAQTPEFLYGLAADSTWIPGAPVGFRCGGDVQVSGRVLCVQRGERLSYVLQSAPADPPVYLTWLIRPGPGGCTIRLQIDEIDTADSREDAEDIWLPVLEALQQLVNPGSLPEAGTKARSGYGVGCPHPRLAGVRAHSPRYPASMTAATIAFCAPEPQNAG